MRIYVVELVCLLLTWFNLNSSMDKELHAQLSVRWNYLTFPKRQRLHPCGLGKDT